MQKERERRIEAYRNAIDKGSADVAYLRVLLLGTAGVGMTSFKRSLMKLPWEPNTSTGVSDNSPLRQFTHEWHTLKEDQFRVVSNEDEIEELAGLILATNEDVTDTPDDEGSPPEPDEITAKVNKIISEVISLIDKLTLPDKLKPQPFLHIWDCGGQQPFLEVLPVFLTSRTLFFLIFNAKKDLNIKSLDQEEVHMMTLDYMLSWMANIHGHLMSYDDEGGFCEFPRIYCVGTHGDHVKDRKSEIKKELEQHYQSKDFKALIEDTVIVDNTTSGQGEAEDPSLQALREAVVRFTEEKLVLKTPLSWILFRKIIQFLSQKYDVIPLENAHIIGAACKIPPEDVSHALMFYHELGVLLFYPQIDGMNDKIVINPKYIVDALGEIFPIRENSDVGRYHKEWKLFHDCGILVQPLYVALWKKYKEVSSKNIIEMLIHFRIAVEVKTDKYSPSSSKQYFMPLALKSTQVNSSSITLPSDSNQAAPLHITFNSGFVPPGFFTRFVVLLANVNKMELCFEKDVHRNRVTFRYQDPNSNSIEHIIVTDCHDVIQINVQHHHSDLDSISFTKTCQDICVLLEKTANKVEKVLKKCASGWTVDNKPTRYIFMHKFKYVCTSCPTTTSPHYIKLPPTNPTKDSLVFCDKNTSDYRVLTELEKVWFKDTNQPTPATKMSPTTTAKSRERNNQTKEGVLNISDVSDAELLDITDLVNVIEELQSIDYTEWKTLGLYLRLNYNTLGAIEEKCRGDVKKCLMECMAAWLKGEDEVCREKGGPGPSWSSLATALEKIGANDIARNIRAK